MAAADAPPPIPKRKPVVLVGVAVAVIAVVIVIAFVLFQPRPIVARETASPNPASPGQTVTFRYYLLNGGSAALTVDRIQSIAYYNGSFFLAINFTSASPEWRSSSVAAGQEVQVMEGTFLVTTQFVGSWLERCTYFTSAGQVTSDVTYTFAL